jgi:hypothetical protein
MRSFGLFGVLLIFGISVPVSAQSPFPAQRLVFAQEQLTLRQFVETLNQQSGMVLELGSLDPTSKISLKNGHFWESLDLVASQTGSRLLPIRKGAGLRLVKSPQPGPSPAYDGPFRLAVRQISSVKDFDLGQNNTEIALDLNWEPRYPVFRIESEPLIRDARTDTGLKLEFQPNRTKIPLNGSQHQPTIRLKGIPRAAKTVSIQGEYTITAAEKMLNLPFTFAKVPEKQTLEGVTVTLSRAEMIDNRVELQLDLEYPKDHPDFESFETFVTRNTAALKNEAQQLWEPSDYEISSQGRRVSAVYRFTSKAGPLVWDPKKWSLNYRTPGPLKDFTIRFQFSGIELP